MFNRLLEGCPPILFLALVASGPATAGVDVLINADAAGTVQNEVRITRNPTDSANLVVAYNDNAGASSSPLGVSYSFDGGGTWFDTQLGIPLHPVLGTLDDGTSMSFIFDPFIDSDSTGTIYAGYIATDGTSGGPSGLFIESSADKGVTWSGPELIDFDIRSTNFPPPPPDLYRFNDRPDMTVDGNDDVYTVWIKDVGVSQPTSDIYFAKSPPPVVPGPGNPTGLDFSGGSAGSVAPQTVNDGANGIDKANVPDVAVASNGTVYVAWIEVDVTDPNPKPGTLKIDSSTNGGVTFGTDITVLAIAALPSKLATTGGSSDDAIAGSYPAIAVAPAKPLTVYLVYSADPMGADEADIFFLRSVDGGVNWSTPLRLNDDPTVNDQFHPTIAVKANGTIDVAWYDKRNAAADDRWDVYFSSSTDEGLTFSANTRISDQTFTTPTDLGGGQDWLGEYLGLEVGATDAYLAFTSSVNDSRGDVFFDSLANVCPPTLTLAVQTVTGTQTLEATATATLGGNLSINGTDIRINAPTISLVEDVEIGGTFAAGNATACP